MDFAAILSRVITQRESQPLAYLVGRILQYHIEGQAANVELDTNQRMWPRVTTKMSADRHCHAELWGEPRAAVASRESFPV